MPARFRGRSAGIARHRDGSTGIQAFRANLALRREP